MDSFNNRVGFGTTTPEDTVHVQGDMKVDGTHVDIDTTGDTVVDSSKIKLTSTDWTTLMDGFVGIDIDIPNAQLRGLYIRILLKTALDPMSSLGYLFALEAIFKTKRCR